MTPAALLPHDDNATRHANGKNTSAVAATATPEARDQPVHLSSADVIRLEQAFGAHKYPFNVFACNASILIGICY
jgi:hypothetical protein